MKKLLSAVIAILMVVTLCSSAVFAQGIDKPVLSEMTDMECLDFLNVYAD